MNIQLSLLTIELLTAALGLGILVLGLIVPKGSKRGLGYVTVLGLLGILVYAFFYQWDVQGVLFNGMYLVDQYATFFKILFLIAGILVVMGSLRYVDKNIEAQSEYYSMTVFATLGMMIMASAGDFITFYLGLELMTMSFIILVAFRKQDKKSVEAGMKYVLLAGLSSAVLLYGMSLLYGMTGSVIFTDVAKSLMNNATSPLLIVGLVMVVAGLGFKISAVPFHMWAPDVYEGAPTPVTSYLAVGSKAASFAIFVRFFVSGLIGLQGNWNMLIAILAVISMIIGNLVAIPQTNIKRMLAYSSIAQAGYILVGLVTGTEAGIKGIMFYAFLYLFATLGAFTVVAAVYDKTGSDDIADYAGMAQRAPLLAAVMTISLLSMAGIPPLAGFVGKFYLFKTVVADYMWIAYIGLIMSMISVYYYLRVALVMFRNEPVDNTPIRVSAPVAITLIVTMLATIVIGIYPGPVSDFINSAAHSFFIH